MSAKLEHFPYERVLDHLTTAILVVDNRLGLKYMNPACEMLFSTSARQIKDLCISDLIPQTKRFPGVLERALTSGSAFTEYELDLTLNTGLAVTIDCSVTPVVDDRQVKHLVIEMAPVERHLQINREEHLLAQQHFSHLVLRGIAHEIKNPLGGLRGAAQLLECELVEEHLKEYTRVIMREADRLKNLLDRMFGPARKLQRRSVNIHEILERVHKLISAEASANIRIVRDYDPSIPEIGVDFDLLVQALLNIARNAVQAVEKNGSVTLRSRTQHRIMIGQKFHKIVARIDIIDTGPGVPAHMLSNIFLPMVSGRAEGTGLGLAIAQGIINQHHGIIECQSQPGRTIFTVYIPLESMGE